MTRKQANLIAIAKEHGVTAMLARSHDSVIYVIPYTTRDDIGGEMLIPVKSYREAFAELGY